MNSTNKLFTKSADLTRNWTQITCLAVNHLTITLECFLSLCGTLTGTLFMHGWFCPIRPIRPGTLNYEKGQLKAAVLLCTLYPVSESAILSLPSATKLRKGNIFTSVCQEFCPLGGVCLSACWDTPPPRAVTPPGQTPPLLADGYCTRRYASYWNAFLLTFNFVFRHGIHMRETVHNWLVCLTIPKA